MEIVRLEAAAGGAGGSWFVLLEGLARLIERHQPGLRIVVVEGGGVANHADVGSGRLPMGILNPPMTMAACGGRPPFDRAYPGLRVGLTNLTVNHLQFMVERSLPIQSLEECARQRYPLRIPVDRVGTVDRLVFELALVRAGTSLDELESWGGLAVAADNYHQQLDLYRAGQVDALWQFMGVPSPTIEAAHAAHPLRPLTLAASLISLLSTRGWQPDYLPLGAYGMSDEPVSTVSMGTSLGFHSGVPETVVEAIVTVLCEQAESLRQIHPAAAQFDPARANLNPGGPLHPGAERAFRRQLTKSSGSTALTG